MKKKIRDLLNNYEGENRHLSGHHDRMNGTLKSWGNHAPGKPLSVHTGNTLSGHNDHFDRFSQNFDYIDDEDKKEVNSSIYDLSELALMLHDPEFITDTSHDNMSENHQDANAILRDYLERFGPEDGSEKLIEDLYRPMLSTLLDESSDEQNVLHQVLSPEMVKETGHDSKDFSSLLKTMLILPVLDGHNKSHWKNNLKKIHKEEIENA